MKVHQKDCVITHAVRAPALPRVCGAETSLEGFTAGGWLWARPVNEHEQRGKNPRPAG
jgi:hypothetical protein